MDIQESLKVVSDKQNAFKYSAENASAALLGYFVVVIGHCYEHNCPNVIKNFKSDLALADNASKKAANTFIQHFTGYELNDKGNPSINTSAQELRKSEGMNALNEIKQSSLKDWMQSFNKSFGETPEGQREKAKAKAKRVEKARELVAKADANNLVARHIANLRAELEEIPEHQALDMIIAMVEKARTAKLAVRKGVNDAINSVTTDAA